VDVIDYGGKMNTTPQQYAIDDTGEKPPFKIGTKCTFFGVNPHAPDLCPTCGTSLQTVDEEAFWKRLQLFEEGVYEFDHFKGDGAKSPDPDWRPRTHPGYVEMWKWAKGTGRCFHHVAHIKNSYAKNAGKVVDLTL